MTAAFALLPDRPIPLAEIPADIRLQIIGAAGAGFPSPAQDWEETGINLVELLRLDRAASFVFEVRGNSMIDAGIYDRDVVVVDRDKRPSNGKIVIAIVDGGFVVRQLCTRDGGAFLEARNSRMSYPETSAENVEIWGVVRASVRNLQA
ncbi:LexA family protein [Sphingomonas yabuuchiae]|jgi:DNA polymerase V|uniref:DNA polymerase V n=1 Tax=Sphingomonas yabuuchiae TaxID=172044 RepID=A0AA41DAY1_9SPHN|nr:S24 family peptidase [Sphingomonas yabuuchiae]MBB4611427.1 DNA polymerase V [Sphingomonas yabuuchiae]MBN3556826.1 peptidase [Sphingomonas yabuuchiae]